MSLTSLTSVIYRLITQVVTGQTCVYKLYTANVVYQYQILPCSNRKQTIIINLNAIISYIIFKQCMCLGIEKIILNMYIMIVMAL